MSVSFRRFRFLHTHIALLSERLARRTARSCKANVWVELCARTCQSSTHASQFPNANGLDSCPVMVSFLLPFHRALVSWQFPVCVFFSHPSTITTPTDLHKVWVIRNDFQNSLYSVKIEKLFYDLTSDFSSFLHFLIFVSVFWLPFLKSVEIFKKQQLFFDEFLKK